MSLKRMELYLEAHRMLFWAEEIRGRIGNRIELFEDNRRIGDIRLSSDDMKRLADFLLVEARYIDSKTPRSNPL